jgi:hypothetical protein
MSREARRIVGPDVGPGIRHYVASEPAALDDSIEISRMVCRPSGAAVLFIRIPRAYARGYFLAPLRGSLN